MKNFNISDDIIIWFSIPSCVFSNEEAETSEGCSIVFDILRFVFIVRTKAQFFGVLKREKSNILAFLTPKMDSLTPKTLEKSLNNIEIRPNFTCPVSRGLVMDLAALKDNFR